ncbi:MAG: thermosome subunit beta [Candidatus Poseidoniales archaeon]|jgi:chaperonin GroEL (HSP60 family)|tara:strand:+ start:411 stop:2024 length:1614 start_codon:yes stop_codon:yes gene_type:complete
MTESEHDIALEDTDRIKGHAALVNNVKAAVALAGAVRSTLGPKGLDKMLVGEDGTSIVTNDGVTVLETAKVEHPTAQLLISTSSSQDRAARDGTTTTVLLMAEILQNSLELVRMGLHPTVIINGYRMALEESVAELLRISKEIPDKKYEKAIISTTLAGKIESSVLTLLANSAIEAAEILSDEDGGEDLERLRVKRLQVSNGGIKDSELIHGLVLSKTRLDPQTSSFSNGGRVAIIDGGFENKKIDMDASIEVTNTGSLREFHDRSLIKIRKLVEHLTSLNIDLLIVRDGVAEDATSSLTKAGITVYRRLERQDIELLSKMTGANLIRNPLKIKDSDVGSYAKRNEKLISNIKHTTIEGSHGGGMTFVIRGSSPEVRGEVKRAFDDALGVAHRLKRHPQMLPGGGASHVHLARHLRIFASSQSGREQLAIEAYAAALEIIPRVLAENSGFDPIDTVLSLSAAQNNGGSDGSWIGLDIKLGQNANMMEAGILDPLFVAKHAITGATESAINVLRIDDVLWAKQDAQTPDWQNESENED